MGTGVGEAMLIGAAVGGGTSAITGGDPLKGALIGAAGGGIGAGLGAGFSAASAAPTIGSSTAASSFGTLGAGTGAAGTGVGATAFNPALYTAGTAPGALSATGGAGFGSTLGTAGATAVPGAVGGGAGFGGIGATGGTGLGTSVAGYTPGMYEGLAAAPTNAVSSVPFSTQTLTSANPPFSIRDLLNKAPTPDITGDSEAQRQVIKATGKNIFGYMPGEKGFISDPMLAAIGGGSALLGRKDSTGLPDEEDYVSSFDPSKFIRSTPTYAPGSVYVPEYKDYRTAAEGGIVQLANGGPVERMSMMNTAMNPQGGLYPQGMIDKTQYATPTQRPVSAEMVDEAPAYERSSPMLMAEGGQIPISLQGSVNLNPSNMAPQAFSGAATSGPGMGPQGQMNHMYQPPMSQISPGGPGGIGAAQLAVLPRTMAGGGIAGILEDAKAQGLTPEAYQQIYGRGNSILEMQKALNMAHGGISSLGGYSDGGRMLKGPGDGMSDSIPGVIANKQPARLADGEFVIPADVVSHLGNGSTDAGAKQLYKLRQLKLTDICLPNGFKDSASRN